MLQNALQCSGLLWFALGSLETLENMKNLEDLARQLMDKLESTDLESLLQGKLKNIARGNLVA